MHCGALAEPTEEGWQAVAEQHQTRRAISCRVSWTQCQSAFLLRLLTAGPEVPGFPLSAPGTVLAWEVWSFPNTATMSHTCRIRSTLLSPLLSVSRRFVFFVCMPPKLVAETLVALTKISYSILGYQNSPASVSGSDSLGCAPKLAPLCRRSGGTMAYHVSVVPPAGRRAGVSFVKRLFGVQ